jgi:hypothetical protein
MNYLVLNLSPKRFEPSTSLSTGSDTLFSDSLKLPSNSPLKKERPNAKRIISINCITRDLKNFVLYGK